MQREAASASAAPAAAAPGRLSGLERPQGAEGAWAQAADKARRQPIVMLLNHNMNKLSRYTTNTQPLTAGWRRPRQSSHVGRRVRVLDWHRTNAARCDGVGRGSGDCRAQLCRQRSGFARRDAASRRCGSTAPGRHYRIVVASPHRTGDGLPADRPETQCADRPGRRAARLPPAVRPL